MSEKKLYIFCWYDKVDKSYMPDTLRVHYSKRNMSRGYLTEFENNKKMNFDEFDLCVIGEYDEFTGVITPYSKPEVINPKMVYAKADADESE